MSKTGTRSPKSLQATVIRDDPQGKKLPPSFGKREAWRLLYFTAGLFRESSLSAAVATAREIAAERGCSVVFEAVYEAPEAVAPRLRRERKALVHP